jgi:hypothetical protein
LTDVLVLWYPERDVMIRVDLRPQEGVDLQPGEAAGTLVSASGAARLIEGDFDWRIFRENDVFAA